MVYLGAMHYYFWQGIKAAICGLDDDIDVGPALGTKTTKSCVQAYIDGYTLGLELTPKEYMEMVL
jgi:hypothetical protein